LTIALASADGFLATLHTFDPATNTAQQQTNGIWYHVRAVNESRWHPVTRVHIFLLSIEAPDDSGEFKEIWAGDAALGWRHEANSEPKDVGYPVECDLCHVLRGAAEVRLSPITKGRAPDTLAGPFKISVTLQARGIEADSNLLRLEISWDGRWADGMTEMKRHLVVKPI
jgi:hypothetical protein